MTIEVTDADRAALKSLAEKMEASGCYTVVFKGRPRDLPGNPFHIQSPFGTPIAMGYGNAYDVKEDVENLLNEIGGIVMG